MPTAAQIEAARTPKGGWTKATLAGWGVSWPPQKGWRDRLIAEAENAPPAPGLWPILALRSGQCRYACTPFHAARDDHRFCGEPTTGVNSSYCEAHRAIVYRAGTVQVDGDEAEGMAA